MSDSTYYRDALKRFSIKQDEALGNTPRDTSWVDTLTEERAKQILLSLEGSEGIVQNYLEGIKSKKGKET